MARRIAATIVAVATCLVMAACGGSPSGPGPVIPPPPPPPPSNEVPRIQSFTLQKDRVEAGEEISVSVVVSDAETPVDQLTYEWQSDVGTFTGQGPAVRWRAPSGTQTPGDYVLTLRITEVYGSPDASGVRPRHQVTGLSASIRVHDSPKEVGDMAVRFLTDFANSSVAPEVAVREFTDSCRGKREELEQIQDNRRKYRILSSQLRLRSVSVSSSNVSATAQVSCEFVSRIVECPQGVLACQPGRTERVRGECRVTSVYENRRWWLCESNFDGELIPSMRAFIRRR
jgi:hypothetical protein